MSKEAKPLIIAHRGSSENAFQNSIEAFQLAVNDKADMIELDTHLTKDGFFIVHHDKVIKTEDKNFLILETKLEELESITLPNKEKIPLLEDVLKNFLPQIKFNVEIKCKLTQSQFINLLENVGGDSSRIIVSTFIFDVLTELKNSKLDYSLAYLYYLPTLNVVQKSNLPYISAMNPFHRFLTSKLVQKYHSREKKVFPYVINDEKFIKRNLKFGVDGIITDNPLETRKILNRVLI